MSDDLRLSASDRSRLWSQLIAVAGPALRSIPWATAVVILGWCTRDVLIAFAGQSTKADVIVQLIADFRLAVVLPWLLAAGGVGYGVRQKQLKEKAVQRLTRRPHELEKIIDPERTSSGLTPRGRTNPEDR